MEKIKTLFKENLGWLIAGATYVIAGGIFILFFLPQMYLKISSENKLLGITNMLEDQTKQNPVLGEKHIQELNKIRAIYRKEIENVVRFYNENYDQRFEKWFKQLPFEECKKCPGKQATAQGYCQRCKMPLIPVYSDFKTIVEKKMDDLEKLLQQKRIGLGKNKDDWEERSEEVLYGLGYDWEKLPDLDEVENQSWYKDEQSRRNVLQVLQKRYWIREYITQIILQNKIKVHRIDEVNFLTPEVPDEIKARGAGVGAERGIHFPTSVVQELRDAYTTKKGAKPAAKEDQIKLMYLWQDTFTFGISVIIDGSDISRFLIALASPAEKISGLDENLPDRLLLQIDYVRIYKLKYMEPIVKKLEFQRGTSESEIKEKVAQEKARLKKELLENPYPVRLYLICSVEDVEEECIRKIAEFVQ